MKYKNESISSSTESLNQEEQNEKFKLIVNKFRGNPIKSKRETNTIFSSKVESINKKENDKKNNYELFPLLSIGFDGKITKYKKNYEYLLEYSRENCEENYKKCGMIIIIF